jgi:hypothetical protein
MASSPLASPDRPAPALRFAANVLVRALLLFAALNALLALGDPLPALGRISAYNAIFPGRRRLPYGEDPDRSYNLSLFSLEAMFAAHEIAVPKPASEYRALLIGDSSTWGTLLRPDETLAAQINAGGYVTRDRRRVRAYNLGYPIMSLAKDLLILQTAMRYEPDLIVWLVTLESFPYDKQLFPPLVQHNPGPMQSLISNYQLRLDLDDPGFVKESFWDRTLLGRRRALADLLRLQLYGVMWAATGIDQDYPDTYEPRQEDFEEDYSFHDLQPPHLAADDLAFDILAAGRARAGDAPMLIVNEPTFISRGKNSDIRYNFFYPRWAYDDYRPLLAAECAARGWRCLDLWDAIPASEFTNSAVHLTPEGTAQLGALVGPAILQVANGEE